MWLITPISAVRRFRRTMARILMAAYTNYRRDPRVRREAEALVRAGHSVTFLASRQLEEARRETIEGVEIRKLPSIGNQKTSALVYVLDYCWFFLLVFGHLLVRPRRYQLIHTNNMPDFLAFSAILPRLFGRPVIHDVHDLMPELYMEKFAVSESKPFIRLLKAQEKWAGRFATVVLTVEGRLKDILASRGIPLQKIHVLMNLPDHRIFRPRPSTAGKSAQSRFVVVYHGTLARRLGLDIALHAVAMIAADIPGLELRIIGAGEERQPLMSLRDALGLQHVVTFSNGFVPVEDIPAMICDADLGLIPLRVSSGTDIMLPTKLLEYVAMGIPCVVPRTGTICRYFDPEMVQFFEAENPGSLSQAILTMYRDPERRDQLATQATARFGDKFNWAGQEKHYVDLVEDLLRKTV